MNNMEEFNLDKILASDNEGSDTEFFPIISDEDQSSLDDFSFPDLLPILPLRNMVLFPGVVMPINVGRDKSLRLIKEAYKNDKIIGTVVLLIILAISWIIIPTIKHSL